MSTAFVVALIGSFALYLIPLVTPHALWLLGPALFEEVLHPRERSVTWIIADVAVALALQAALFGLLWWGVRCRAWIMALGGILLVPVFVGAANAAYLFAIPSYFLIERDSAVDTGNWPEACAVADASLAAIPTPIAQTSVGVSGWWVQRSSGDYALMRVPGCDTADSGLPRPTVQPGGRVDFIYSLQFATTDGAAIIDRTETATGRQTWWLLKAPGAPLIQLPIDRAPEGLPILANNGSEVAWVATIEGSGPPVDRALHIGRVDGREPTIEVQPLNPQTALPLELDEERGLLTMWRDDRPIVIDVERRSTEELPRATTVRSQSSTYKRCGAGWVAWDAYQEQDAYAIAWSLATGAGRYRVPKGRSITSAAVDPACRFVALSTSPTLSIGSVNDAVIVLDARDGREVFRRHLERYARSTVVFFGTDYFAYSDRGVHVVRVPRST